MSTFGFRKFITGLNIKPKTTSTAAAQGDLDITSGNGKINYHNGTTASPVVTEAHSAAFTNKIFDADGTGNSITNIENADIKALAAIDATKIADGSVTSAEFQYLGGVTSDIQTQLNNKQASGSYITALTGDVTASGPGSSAATVAFVGTSSAANVSAAELLANAATNLNTASTIVKRDASGNFTAGTITASLSGNASTATTATNVSGTVAIANGGTGQTTQTAAFDALAPTTTKADIIVHNGTDNVRLSVGTDGQTLVADSSQTTGLKWSQISGIKNYISNSDAEATTNGWATYADAAGALPVDGTGGSPTVTFTRTTSSPLRGTGSFLFTKDAANRQGQGASYDFTIDDADKAKVLQITFDYAIASGTYADSDLTCYVYDVTNAQVIQPTGFSIQNALVNMKQSATFQTNSNSTSYRLIFHTASTSASAYTVKIDTVVVGPQIVTNGAAITDYQSYSLTIGGSGSAPTFGATGGTKNSRWKRDGSDLLIEFDLSNGTGGAAGSGTYLFPIPTGLTIDSSLVRVSTNSAIATAIGSGSYYGGGAVTSTFVFPYNTTNLALQNVDNTNASLATNGNTITFTARVPIVGWSSNVQISSDTDTRVVAAIITGDPASATVGNPIIVPTAGYDSHGAYNTSTGRYTVPISGLYKMFGALQSASSSTTLSIYKNASLIQLVGNLDSNGEATFSGMVSCVTGDLIDIRPGGTVDATNMSLNIERVSGPSIIAANENIACTYTTAAGASVSSTAAVVLFGTKEFDTHSIYNTSTGAITFPISGKYKISSMILIGDVASAAGQTTDLQLRTGSTNNAGTISSQHNQVSNATSDNAFSSIISKTISVLAGDIYSIQARSTYGASRTLVPSAVYNHLSIERVGN